MILPGAVWRGPCRNNSGLRTVRTMGVVLHVNDSLQNVSLWDWVNNPNSDMSCHFQVLQNGVYEQYLDTDWWSWCQADGNNAWISIEMPTVPSVGMTQAQMDTAAFLVRTCAQHYEFPLVLSESPAEAGFGWHGMGGNAWGGHPGCPGAIRRAQRGTIIQSAISGLSTGDDDLSWLQWSKKDQDGLTAAVATAVVNRGMGGIGFNGSLAQMLGADLGQSVATNNLINGDGVHPGLLARVASLQAMVSDLPDRVTAAVDAAIKANGGAGNVDAQQIVTGVFAELRTLFDTVPSTGAHAGVPA